MAKTKFRIAYFNSVLGPLWSVMRPLMLFGVLYVVFTQIVDFGDDITELSGAAADEHGAVHVLQRGDQRGGHVARRQRGAGAQDALPARRDPALDGAHVDV